MKTDLGKAWLVMEESFHNEKKTLISIIDSRKSQAYVANYIEQLYVDRFASFEEAIDYKKNKKSVNYRIERYQISSTMITCGHDPIYRAYRCHALKKFENLLEFRYYIFKKNFDQTIKVEHIGQVNLA